MRILELRAENVMNLKAIEIKPDGNAVILTGKNGAGKSAVLDAIFMALTGKKVDEPIRKGEDRAEVTIALEDGITVTRVWTPTGSTLKVWKPKEGMTFQSPQQLLNKILGELSFNPIAFAEMGKTEAGRRQQREMLIKLVGLNLEDVDAKRNAIYEERTLKNRELKRMEGLLQSLPKPAPGLPEEETSAASILEDIDAMEAAREKCRDHQSTLGEYDQSVARIDAGISDAESKLVSLLNEIQDVKNDIAAGNDRRKWLLAEKASLRAPAEVRDEDIEKVRNELRGLEDRNAKIRQARQFEETERQLKDAQTEIDVLTKEVNSLDAEKKSRIQEASYPVTGLSVDDEGVLFNGIPLNQESTGGQIRVSTAIAMALNPKLRVILIRDGSLLDGDGLQEVIKAAGENDFQVWIEKVSDAGDVGVFIEDGSVKSVNGKTVTHTE